jgi:hypothetical protein
MEKINPLLNFIVVIVISLTTLNVVGKQKKRNKKKKNIMLKKIVLKKRKKTKRKRSIIEICKFYKINSRYCFPDNVFLPEYKKVTGYVKQSFYKRYGTTGNLLKKLKYSSLIPKSEFEYGHYNNIDKSGNAKPGEYNYWDEAFSLRQIFKVKLVWELNRFVFDSREIVLLKEKRNEISLLETYVSRGRSIFFEWYKKVLQLKKRPSVWKVLRLKELEASLNYITMGRFSTLIKR